MGGADVVQNVADSLQFRRALEPKPLLPKKKPRSGGTQYGAEFGKSWPDHVGQRAIIIASPLAHYCSALATPA